jgi:hypothetical protein
VFQLHHLDGRSESTSNLGGQVFTEDVHLFAVRRANVRGKTLLSGVFTAVRRKQEQIWQLAGGQPWKPATVIDSPQCQPPVPIDPVPAQLGDLQSVAPHRLHGIPEERLNVSDFYRHEWRVIAGSLF